MKILTTIMMGLFLTICVSAIYAGETKIVEHNLSVDNLKWMIINNLTELVILPEIETNNTHVKIYFPTDMPPNSFTIVFLENQTNEKEVVVEHHYSSGGSSRIIYVQNKTIKYIDNKTIEYVDRYLDKITYFENETEIINEDTKSLFDSFGFPLFAVIICGGLVGIYFLVPKFIDYLDKGEEKWLNKERDKLSGDDIQ